jgi:uncharacterized protein YjdB
MSRATSTLLFTLLSASAACGGGDPVSPPPPPPPAPVASVTVAPDAPSVVAGATVQLAATARDAQGAALTGRAVTWASSVEAVATVSANGLVTGVAAGTSQVRATVEGRTGEATVTVTPVPVSAVTLSAVPGPLVPGQPLTLVATPRDAQGAALTGRTVTWGSSAEAVATVSQAGVVTAVAAGSATITATSEGRNAAAAITVRDGGWLTPAGGTVTAAGGNLVITVPAGALAIATAITVDPVVAPPVTTNLVPGTAYDLGPALAFAQPVVVRISYAAGSVPAGVPPAELRVGKLTNGEWRDLAGSTVDVAGLSATGASTTFSTWGVVARVIGSVTVTPSAPAVAVGNTIQLSVDATDYQGNSMPSGPATWTSQSPAVATVGATTGLVTGVSAGTALITGTRGGKSAAVTVSVNTITFSLSTNPASSNGGGGTIACSTTGVGGPFGACAPSYNAGTTLTLQATPNSASNFTSWTATVCSGAGTCQFTVTANTTVTATFNRPTLTVQVLGTGSVSSNPAGINNCATNCSAAFNKGTLVTLTAGIGFSGWSGGGCSGTGTCQVTLNTDTSVAANLGGAGLPGKIAYTNPVAVPGGSLLEIFTINPDGTGRTRLSVNTIDEWPGPDFSRDGSRVAFSSFRNAYVMNSNGTNVTQLTFFSSGAANLGVAISPDGTRIAFHNPIDFNIYVINEDGTNLRQVTNNPAGGQNPNFSPDGTRLIFDRRTGPLGLPNLYVINVDGTNETRLTDYFEGGGRFSPDGTRITYTGRTPPGNTFNGIFVMNADGTNRRQLTSGAVQDQSSSFSLDGTLIAFSRSVTAAGRTNNEIFVMNADGTNLRQVTFFAIGGGSGEAPKWVP